MLVNFLLGMHVQLSLMIKLFSLEEGKPLTFHPRWEKQQFIIIQDLLRTYLISMLNVCFMDVDLLLMEIIKRPFFSLFLIEINAYYFRFTLFLVERVWKGMVSCQI